MQVADFSRQSTGRVLTIAECQAIKDQGNQGVVVGLFDGTTVNPYAPQTVTNAMCVSGLFVAGYTALSTYVSGTDAVRLALGGLGPIERAHLFMLSLDVELDGVTQDNLNASIVECVRQLQRPCIYSAYWFWWHFGNPTNYGPRGLRVPLWNANYNGHPDQSGFNQYPYGGWQDWGGALVVGDQYQNTTVDPGSSPAFSVDYSYFRDDWVRGRF